MSHISQNIEKILSQTSHAPNTLVAVSKTKPNSMIVEAYEAGQIDFGENKVQELVSKHEALPKDIQWHMIGHLQRNKVKQIVPFVYLIHSVDSERLLAEIDKEAKKNDRVVNCLLQVHIAKEDTKFGFDEDELRALLNSDRFKSFENINIEGLMGMATFTDDESLIKEEFLSLSALFKKIKTEISLPNVTMKELSMGMSGDYMLALECGSTIIRVGSAIFGERHYA